MDKPHFKRVYSPLNKRQKSPLTFLSRRTCTAFSFYITFKLHLGDARSQKRPHYNDNITSRLVGQVLVRVLSLRSRRKKDSHVNTVLYNKHETIRDRRV